MALPSDAQIAKLTPVADGELHPVGAQSAPANTPLRAGGPIKHVFFVVRENRSYDQMLGDVKRGNGDPKLRGVQQDRDPEHAFAGQPLPAAGQRAGQLGCLDPGALLDQRGHRPRLRHVATGSRTTRGASVPPTSASTP